tara:strand:- start:3834 stop:5246 length:1413 start_codon:yes stop_codon:yes gene_type:complete
VGSAGRTLRERSRDLARNNAVAASAIRVLTADIVGTGIVPRASTGIATLDKQIDSLWTAWVQEASAETDLDVYGLQTLAVRSWLESGEVLIRRRTRRPEDGLPVPLQLQVIEAEHLDDTKAGELKSGGRIVQGVEFDPIGRRSAYWLRDRHPGDSTGVGASLASRPVAAANVAHLYEPLRPGQCRGVPFLAPVMTSIRDLGDYRDAERYRAKVAACFVAFIHGGDVDDQGITDDDYPTDVADVTDSDGIPIENLEPGMMPRLRNGKHVTFSNPPKAGASPAFLTSEQQSIAAGLGMTYEDLSGDLSKVNFSSFKAGRETKNRRIRVIQTQIVVPMICRPIRRWFIDTAVAAGLLPAHPKVHATRWITPAFPEIDRSKEAAADLTEMRTGTLTLGDALARRGLDLEDTLNEHKRTLDLVNELGLVFDSLPSLVSKAGQAQPDTEPDDSEDDEPPEDPVDDEEPPDEGDDDG